MEHISTDALKSLLQKYVDDFMSKKDLDFVVSPSIPVVWFGDIEKYQQSPKRILTISLNPSLHEFPQSPEQPRFDIVDFSNSNAIDALYTTLNRYFYNNPYKNWFKKYNKLMSVLDCSYGGQYSNKTNTAIHIDIYTAIATDPVFGKLTPPQKEHIQNPDLFDRLFELLDPDIVLISVNEKIFKKHFNNYFEAYTFRYGKKSKIKGYLKENQKLIFGTNSNGIPFGSISEAIAQKVIAEIANLSMVEALTAKIQELKTELAKFDDSDT